MPANLFVIALLVSRANEGFAQSDPLSSRTDYRNQLYETNAIGTSIPQPASVAIFCGSIGAATNELVASTNIARPNDGQGIYLLASTIGQPVGMNVVPFNLLVQGSGTITPSPDMYAGTNWYQLGQIISLTATAGRYYGFSNWVDGVSFNPRTVVAGPANSYTAVFTNGPALETNNISGYLRVAPVGTPIVLINGQYYPDDILVTNAGSQVQVTIQTSFPSGTIFYTTDGVTPPENGTAYSGSFIATAPFSIRSVAFSAGFLNSAVADPVSTLSVTTPGAGGVAASTRKDFYTGESSATLTETPDADWTFMTWTNDASGSSKSVTLTVGNYKSVQGIFGTTFNFVTNGGGTIFRNPNQALHPYGSLVQFSAVPAAGSNFVAWGGALTGVSTTPATLTVQSPTQTIVAVFGQLPANSYALSVLVAGNGAVSRNTNANFYASGTVVTLTANPGANQSFINWSGDASGSANPLPVTMNASKIITANFAPTAPVFTMGAASYEVNENAGSVSLTVSNNGTLGGSVDFLTENLTALGGSDYTATNGTLTFTNGEHAKAISIGIVDKFLVDEDRTFKVLLTNQSAGTITHPVDSSVTIHYNDVGATNGSFLVQAMPGPVPNRSASLRINIEPPLPQASGGFWRFPWELGWRNSGELVTNLIQDKYEVEFREIGGYSILPVPAQQVFANAPPTTNEVRQYFSVGSPGVGKLTVNIGPNNPVVTTNAGWRLLGETNWLNPGTTRSNLAAATNYLIEFKPVAGLATPSVLEAAVFPAQQSVIGAYYEVPATLPTNAALPNPLSGLDHINSSFAVSPRLPYTFNGQLQSDVGFGSGFAARVHSVLTAAHLVFNDATLSYVSQVYWFFQKHTTELDPKPATARGWYVLSGYASARTNDLQVNNLDPGVSSPESRSADVAVVYFLDPATAARGGYGGYLASDAATNEWLTGAQPKMLVGYPLDGTPFGYTNIVAGKMHATVATNYTFTLQTNRVYTTTGFLSFPGNSGGPVCALGPNGIYYPAAVYLGTVGSSSAVRAIDGDVVNLLNLAEISATMGDYGTNFTGGGVTRIVTSAVGGAVGYLQVQIGPASALQAGAGWRLAGSANSFSQNPNFTQTFTNQATIWVEFSPAHGWDSPTNTAVTVPVAQLTVIDATYVVLPPTMSFVPGVGFGFTGTTNTKYRIEYRPDLASAQWLPLQTNTITSGGFNLLLPWPPPNGLPAAFYRAVWLP